MEVLNTADWQGHPLGPSGDSGKQDIGEWLRRALGPKNIPIRVVRFTQRLARSTFAEGGPFVPCRLPVRLHAANLTGLLCMSLSAIVFTPTGFAQTLQTPDSEEQRRRTQVEAQERQQQQRAPGVNLQSPTIGEDPDATALPAEPLCFTIGQFILDVPAQLSQSVRQAGAHTLPQDPFYFAQAYLQKYAGQCIGHDGLGLIVRRLTNRILAHGYTTTRIGIPEQDLTKGRLTLTLVPGIIRVIRFTDTAASASWKNAFPARAGDLLNLRDLEQGLEQMKRVASQDVDMQIVPGTDPGESDIVIDVKHKSRWKLVLNFDDTGAKGTGKYQAGLNLAYDNLFGINDLINVGFNTDADRRGGQRGTTGNSVAYSAPYGYWTFGLAASGYRYHQEIAGRNQTFISSGDSKNLDVKIQRLFQRDQTQKNTWQLRVGKRYSLAFIDNVEIGVQLRNTTFLELAWLHRHYFGDAQLDLTLADRRGVNWFNGQGDLPDRESNGPTFRYAVQTADATFVLPFKVAGHALTYVGTARAQTTKSPLYVSEQFSIGNRHTVRGFDGEMTLAAERGFFLRNELAVPLANSGQSVYAGLDVGKVYGPSVQYLSGDKLAGAVLGVRGVLHNLNYEVFAGWALRKPEHFSTSRPAVGFSLIHQY
jgi:hemolysin activation/secretion protein